MLLALVVTFLYVTRTQREAAQPGRTFRLTITVSPTPIASSATSAPPTAALAGAITGGLGYPSDFIPPLTVYAISVADQRIFFSVDTPRYGGGPNPSPPTATITPGTRPGYTMTGVAPGAYYVLAYRNDDVNVEAKNSPGLYSKYVVQCLQPNESGSTPAPGCSTPGDHSLVPVTVTAGDTVRRIDVTDWYYGPAKPNFPPRPR